MEQSTVSSARYKVYKKVIKSKYKQSMQQTLKE